MRFFADAQNDNLPYKNSIKILVLNAAKHLSFMVSVIVISANICGHYVHGRLPTKLGRLFIFYKTVEI